LRPDLAAALFACAGLLHGYALGETIAGAEAAPLYAYFIGLALVQSAIALGALATTQWLAARSAPQQPTSTRLVGGAVAAVGLIVLVQQLATSA
jgi:urease accessory protein